MAKLLPRFYLVRQGETAWSLSGQHTGLADLALAERDKQNSRLFREQLQRLSFVSILTSLLERAGLRIGEAIWFAWDDVDFKANVIRDRAKDDWQPKTGDERAVPITQRLRESLEARPRRSRWVLTANPTSRYPSSDRHIDARRALRALKRVLEKLGIEGMLHTIRHSLISRCLTEGIDEAVVQTWGGHVDADIMRT